MKNPKSGKPPAFQFYAKDWISSKSVRMMNPIQRGYYIQLLAEAWDSIPIGTLPNDSATLRILAGEPDQEAWDKNSAQVIAEFKPIKGGMLMHPRLIVERDKQIEHKAKKSLAGHISAKVKKQKKMSLNTCSPCVDPMLPVCSSSVATEINSSSSISSSSSTKTIKSKPSPAAIELIPAILEIESPEQTETLPLDSRHVRIKALVANAWSTHNGGIQCPWDGSEGKQLQSLLKATPKWHDSQFAQCLSNMYDSGGFAQGTRPREFLPRLPKYLHGPLNEFNREQVTNGTGTPKTAAAGRTNRNLQALVLGSVGDGVQRVHVPDGGTVQPRTTDDGERKTSSVANSEILARKPPIIDA